MSIASLLKRLAKALPVVLANVPAIIEVAKQVGQAFKKPKQPADGGGAAAAEQLGADSGRAAR